MLKRFFYAIGVACCVLHFDAAAQCEVEASIFPKQVACGDEAVLTAQGRGQGLQVFSENFNSGQPTGWAFTQQARFDNPCSLTGVDSTTHIWMGNTSASPRSLETLPYNFSTASSGATICFDMLLATQGAGAPCEGPDLPEEGVYLQYSTNGTTWVTLHYFDPNGGGDPQLVNWNNWCFQLPSAALTPNTQIRWHQIADSGPDYDHWGIDNVNITFNDPTYEIVWQHDGYNYGQGSSGGVNTRPVRPRQTTTYTVSMSNGPYTCTDTVELIVIQPTVEVDAGDDLRVCRDECATINATSKVVKLPAKVSTYVNNEAIEVPPFSTGGKLDLNIQSLNMTNIVPGSILEVCIDNLLYIFANDLDISLVCPDGTRLVLIPAGSATPLGGLFTNTCFTATATDSISSGTGLYTGTFIPGEPLDNLAGCTANGVWSLEIVVNTPGFNAGFINSWSITFDDPEISYTAELTWDPTTGLSDSNSVSPTVCPTQDITYILSGSDTAGCVTDYDTVGVTVDLTDLDISATVSNPNCGADDGAIDLTIGGGSGNYQFTWNNGATTEDITGVGTGIYQVVVNDPAHCAEDTVFNLSTTGGPAITSITPTAETCFGLNNGGATIVASGSGLTYRWNNGRTTATISGLAPGTYTVTVTDGLGCETVERTTVDAGTNVIAFVTPTDESCGDACDGTATVDATGVGGLTFAWSDGSIATPNRTGLCYGLYGFTVTDANNCTESSSFFINGGPLLTVDAGDDFSFCQGNVRTLDAGPGFAQYNWSTSETTRMIDVTASGDYIVTVSNGPCDAIDTVTVDVVANPVVNALPDDTSLIIGTGITVDATVSGGVAGTYQWTPADATLSCADCPAPVITPAGEGELEYVVVFITDALECQGVDTVFITVLPENFTPVFPGAFSPNGDTQNDKIRVLPENLVMKEFKVYNRWGQEVYNGTDAWNGEFNGKEQPIGTYSYYAVVELPDGSPKTMKGVFSLLR